MPGEAPHVTWSSSLPRRRSAQYGFERVQHRSIRLQQPVGRAFDLGQGTNAGQAVAVAGPCGVEPIIQAIDDDTVEGGTLEDTYSRNIYWLQIPSPCRDQSS